VATANGTACACKPVKTLVMMFFTFCGYPLVVLADGRVSPMMPKVNVAIFTGASVGAGNVGVPPPGWQVSLGEQLCPLGQVPQFNVFPQPSGIVPQFFPCAAQVVGVQLLV
jgi:hypothetical protein